MFFAGQELDQKIHDSLNKDAKSITKLVEKLDNNEEVIPKRCDHVYYVGDTSFFMRSRNDKGN